MTRYPLIAALLLAPGWAYAATQALIVEGLAGDPDYGEQFERQSASIERALQSVTDSDRVDLLRGAAATRAAILERLDALAASLHDDDRFMLFLVGHGSYDDYDYKFNLPGPDLTGIDIVTALDALPARNQLLVNTSSASGAIREQAGAAGRIVILATRSGAERHATRFGNYFAEALGDDSADTDKNGRISAEEAFRYAERRVSDYFERNDQLATEHPTLAGEQADRIALARLGGARPAIVDTGLAELVARRDALNTEIDDLRLARPDMAPADYQSALLDKMLELARIEDAIEARQGELDGLD